MKPTNAVAALATASLALFFWVPPLAADHGACACQQAFDPCLIGDWQVEPQALRDYWQETAAQILGLQVRSTDGQVMLTVQSDSAFTAQIDLSSRATAAGNMEVASRVTGAPNGTVCVVPNGRICSNHVNGKINVTNWLKISGQSVPTPKMAFPATRERENHGRALPYRCQGNSLEVTFRNRGKDRIFRAKRR